LKLLGHLIEGRVLGNLLCHLLYAWVLRKQLFHTNQKNPSFK
jgi:hypothetical protein